MSLCFIIPETQDLRVCKTVCQGDSQRVSRVMTKCEIIVSQHTEVLKSINSFLKTEERLNEAFVKIFVQMIC